jgi:hypothetical protein
MRLMILVAFYSPRYRLPFYRADPSDTDENSRIRFFVTTTKVLPKKSISSIRNPTAPASPTI